LPSLILSHEKGVRRESTKPFLTRQVAAQREPLSLPEAQAAASLYAAIRLVVRAALAERPQNAHASAGDACVQRKAAVNGDGDAAWLTVPQAAKRAGVSRDTILRLMAKGRLPYGMTDAERDNKRIFARDLDNWLRSNAQAEKESTDDSHHNTPAAMVGGHRNRAPRDPA
jgi:excisionase family DNA binding protein